jgi:hypothetical protein
VDVRDAWRRTLGRRDADQPNSLKAAVRAARKPNPFNTLTEDSGAPLAPRYAAGLAEPTGICWSAYCSLAGQFCRARSFE